MANLSVLMVENYSEPSPIKEPIKCAAVFADNFKVLK
jgi:hypothetical protein